MRPKDVDGQGEIVLYNAQGCRWPGERLQRLPIEGKGFVWAEDELEWNMSIYCIGSLGWLPGTVINDAGRTELNGMQRKALGSQDVIDESPISGTCHEERCPRAGKRPTSEGGLGLGDVQGDIQELEWTSSGRGWF